MLLKMQTNSSISLLWTSFQCRCMVQKRSEFIFCFSFFLIVNTCVKYCVTFCLFNSLDLIFCRYWPVIDNALRAAAIDRRISVKLLISWWKHSRPAEDYFLNSLQVISNSYRGVDIQVVISSK